MGSDQINFFEDRELNDVGVRIGIDVVVAPACGNRRARFGPIEVR
jgi:hypothetical protein